MPMPLADGRGPERRRCVGPAPPGDAQTLTFTARSTFMRKVDTTFCGSVLRGSSAEGVGRRQGRFEERQTSRYPVTAWRSIALAWGTVLPCEAMSTSGHR